MMILLPEAKFLTFLALLLMCEVSGQTAQGFFWPETPSKKLVFRAASSLSSAVRPTSEKPASRYFPRPQTVTEQWPWSCRQEWKLEKALSVPLKIRLGSVEQSDFLEGKKTGWR